MDERVNKVWLAVIVGFLIATSNNWMSGEKHSNYDAPWVYPGNLEK